MHSLIFDQVSFGYSGADEILRDLSLSFTASGWTAIVGDNGAGKSTLLRLATGELAPTRGHVRRTHIETCAVVPQRVDELDAAIIAFAYDPYRAAARWRARLALDPESLGRWPTLSPGERKRWQIAAALAGEPDLLVVDEPSNHLDAEALARCTGALAAHRGIGLLVSHDRQLLEQLPRHTVRLHAGTARMWPGAYREASAAWTAEQAAARTRREELSATRKKVERQLADARRREQSASRQVSTSARMRNLHDSDARTIGARNLAAWAAAQAGRQVDRLHTRVSRARDEEASLHVERERGAALHLGWEPPPRRWLVQLTVPELRAGDHVVARDVRVAVEREQRIHLRGPNGAGKSTLLRALAAACTLPAERVLVLPQEIDAESGAELARTIRALDHARRGRLGQLADALGLDPERAVRSELPSPGEARKLALAFGLTLQPWLVLLDEPTNHLDLPSIERLEAALVDYPGALVLISHDADLAQALCSSTWEIGDTSVTTFCEPVTQHARRSAVVDA